jgi:hypothetical protein
MTQICEANRVRSIKFVGKGLVIHKKNPKFQQKNRFMGMGVILGDSQTLKCRQVPRIEN